MADKNYHLNYTADNNDLLAKTNVLVRALRLLDQVADRLVPKLKGLFSAGTRSANSAAAANQKVAASLQAVSGAAYNAAGAVNTLGQAKAKMAANARQASSSVAGFVARMLALRAATEVLESVRDYWDEIKDRARETAEYVAKTRDASRELASLMNEEGPNNKVLAREAETALATSTTPEQAREYLQQYLGVANIGEELHNITPEVNKDLSVAALAFTHRINVPEGVAGAVVGRIAQFRKVANVAEGMEELAEAAYGIQQGKGEYRQGFKALDKVAPVMVGAAGGTRSLAHTGVLLGVYSQIAGSFDQAQTMMVQTRRLLTETEGPKGEYLKSIGIDPKSQTLDQMLEKLAPHVAGPGGEEVLTKIGFHAKREREVTVAATKQLAVMRERVGRIDRENMGATAMAETNHYQATDQHAINTRADTAERVRKLVEGIATEPAQAARKIADTRLRASDPNYNSLTRKIAGAVMVPLTGWSGGGDPDYQDLGPEAGAVVPTLERQGRKVGIDVKRQFPNVTAFSQVPREQAITQAIQAIQAKGGDPYDLASLNRQQLEELRRISAKMGGAPAPRPAPAGPLPVDNGGAGPRRAGQ